jgi:hypothetical protein
MSGLAVYSTSGLQASAEIVSLYDPEEKRR